jgi:hypothetical protein
MGFRAFFWLAVVCIIVGVFAVYVPGCQPDDVSNCTWVENHYECPEDK